jgi:hypothetical protein
VRFTRVAHAQVLVETAMVFPLLVMVAMGLVQFSIYYHARNVVEMAVQEAARTAAARGASCSDGQHRGEDLIAAGLSSRLHIQVQVCRGDDADPDLVRAEVNDALPTFIPWFTFHDGPTHLNLPLRATALASKERFRGGPEVRR